MLMKVCSIWDAKAEAYLQPFFVQSTGQAVRAFGDLCGDPEHPVGMHPEDYTLFCLAEWDERLGKFVLESVPVALSRGIHLSEAD